MRIALEALSLLGDRTGVGRYTEHLVRSLIRYASDAMEELHLLFFAVALRRKTRRLLKQTVHDLDEWSPVLRCTSCPIPLGVLYRSWDYLGFPPVEWLTGDVDICHGPNYIVPPSRTARTLATVHDMTLFTFPEAYTRDALAVRPRIVRSLHRCDAMLADSEATKRDLMDVLHIPEDQITVVYLAPSLRWTVEEGGNHDGRRKADDTRPLSGQDGGAQDRLRAYGIYRPYLLCVGTIEPRKNIARLVRAYGRLRQEKKIPHQLVLAGKWGWKYKDVVDTVEELSREVLRPEDIVFMGYVSKGDLRTLYREAEVCVYPSLYEGFGLSPLEAMACGTPVVTSNISALPEVIGNAGVLVDPYDVEALAEGIYTVIDHPALREAMREKGWAQAQRFTWERCAKETMAVYRRLL